MLQHVIGSFHGLVIKGSPDYSSATPLRETPSGSSK
jgi:hypothetical protein